MDYITLDASQWNLLLNSKERVQVFGPDGTPVGFIQQPKLPEPVEDLEELNRRRQSTLPCYTGEQVLEHLRSLDRS